jgi:4-amino-4-deoxy-L-arabinose transferase-like glycosyltransferase
MARNLKFTLKTSDIRELNWRASLAALTIFSGLTNLWGLAHVDRGEYYATAPNSMSRSLSNFIFGAMDPGGVVTVDKIPGSFWIPAIFVKIFGFSTWAITVPNALAAIAAILIITFVVKKYYGMTAGLIAGWILATTPIVVAVARSNQPQSIYYLAIAIAIRYSIIALNEQSRKHLIWAGIWIAIAFHTYMLLAWALWPPLILGYLVTSQSWKKKTKDLLLAGLVSFFASAIWILIVSLTPASRRPFIGGTDSNSGLELVFGYNGFGRFTQLHVAGVESQHRTFTPPFGGKAGPFRFFNEFLIGQISWLLPTAIIAIFMMIYLKHKSPIFIFASSYLILQLVIFSEVLGMHQFYVSTMALPIALIIAFAIFQFRALAKPYFIIAIIMVTASWAILITLKLNSYLFPTPLFQIAFLILFLTFSIIKVKRIPEITTSILFIGALVLTPALWAVDTVHRSDPYNPMAGPTFAELGIVSAQKSMNRVGGVVEAQSPQQIAWQDDINLIKYIRSKSDSKFALAIFTGVSAAPYINATKDLIYPIGGFNGEDPLPTLSAFKSYVKEGSIRFVLGKSVNSNPQSSPTKGVRGKQGNQNTAKISNQDQIQAWVQQNCLQDSYEVKGFRLLDCRKR